jgi:hypothetical protein
MGEDHSWMYSGWDKEGNDTDKWMDNTTTFLDCAFSLSKIMWCPCSRCQNTRCLEDKTTIAILVPGTRVIGEDEQDYDVGVDRMDEIFEPIQGEVTKVPPTTEVETFFKLLKASEEPLHEHTDVTFLTFITQLMVIKSKYLFFNNCYNDLIKLISNVIHKPHKVPKDM